MDKSLLIAVFVPTTDETDKDFQGQRGELATGYPVGKNLILTARHVLQPKPPYYRDRRYPLKLRWHYFRSMDSGDKSDWIEIPDEDIVWQSQGDLDAALIRCPRPYDAVGWGIVSRDKPSDGMKWASEGFPRATKYENRRNPSSFIGKMCSKAPKEPYFELTVVAAPEDEDDWKGASGMPVFAGRKIVGVVQSVPKNFKAEKLYATPTWKLLEDEDFRKQIDYDEQIKRVNRIKDKLVKILQGSPDAVHILIEQEQLGVKDDMAGLDDDKKADQLAERLLGTKLDVAIQVLRNAHRLLSDNDGESTESNRRASETLTKVAQLIVPALYDHGVVQWTRRQRGGGSAALVLLPACLKTVAEIIMAGVDGRASRFRHREDEDDQPEGELSLPQIPESGIDDVKVKTKDALQRHLNKKFNPAESEAFRHTVDDYLLATYSRPARGVPERTREERIKLTADLLESKRRDSGQTFYMLFYLPEDAEGQNATRNLAASLKESYPAITFLSLDTSFEQEREERMLFDPFCRMLPLKACEPTDKEGRQS